MEDGLHLHARGLLSKWGFGDGDMPDRLMDLLDECAPDGWTAVDWHPVLVGLVRDYLLPALDQHVEVYGLKTIHNPIRAETVDGAPVDDYAEADTNPRLTPDGVTVPWDEVLRRCRAV